MTPAESTAKYRKRHPKRVKANRKKHYKREAATALARRTDPERWPTAVMPHLRSRAKQYGRVFTITPSDIRVPARCPVLGFPIVVNEGRPQRNSPSVDRIDNTLGYTPDNVCVISHRANQLKRNASLDELKRIVAYMEAGG